MQDHWLTVQDVARLLKLSELTIYKYIRSGQLQAVAFGGHYRIKKNFLETFISRHNVKTTELQEEEII